MPEDEVKIGAWAKQGSRLEERLPVRHGGAWGHGGIEASGHELTGKRRRTPKTNQDLTSTTDIWATQPVGRGPWAVHHRLFATCPLARRCWSCAEKKEMSRMYNVAMRPRLVRNPPESPPNSIHKSLSLPAYPVAILYIDTTWLAPLSSSAISRLTHHASNTRSERAV